MPFFTTLLGSFYSAALYQRVRAEGRYALGYSFLLVAFSSLVLVIYGVSLIQQALFLPRGGEPMFDRAVHDIMRQLPAMEYRDGTLATNPAKPHFISLYIDAFGTHERMLIATIDTTGATTLENAETPFLVTARHIIIKKKGEIRVEPLNELLGNGGNSLVLSRETLNGYGDLIIDWMHHNLTELYLLIGAVAWLGVTLILYVLRLATLAALAGLAILILASRNIKLPFPRAMALATTSYTPVALANLASMVLFGASADGLLLFIAGGGMLWAALNVSEADTTLAASA